MSESTLTVSSVRPAPAGFTEQTWDSFWRDGFLVIEDALTPDQVQTLRAAVNDCGDSQAWNVVERDRRLAELIDHPSHIGYVHDVYGEMLKLLRSEFFRREPGVEIRNKWHFDGPRSTPFSVFSPDVPLRIKVGYWLTPLPHEEMGNLVYVPGSHRSDHLPEYHTHASNAAERALLIKPGAMTLMWSGLWHRVAENRGDITRLNVFLEYGPSWLVTSDRVRSSSEWLAGLTRERRIIMRDYDQPNSFVKLPAEDVPLYGLRAGEEDLEESVYGDHVPLELRKRSTWIERRSPR